ncbi:hypothetical protein ABLE93_20670 [Xanthobacter sp. KR7-65]|uniref:hypothetical protein n=1 Tax=Xanthobacter sp. KR7-65 TaxID=3156612 RepID=UPI0032B380CC
MTTIDRKSVMRRAWSLFRQSMALRFDRAAFAAHLRQAWAEAREAPVTAWPVLQRYVICHRGMSRAEIIARAELALATARSRFAGYSRAAAPRNWSAGKHRSADMMRVANLEAIVRAEKAAAGLAA